MKISEKFDDLDENEAALISYVCAGDPSPDATKNIVSSLVRGGADIIELGLPFSDPMADGPTIQAASKRAIEAGMNPDLYFELVSSISNKFNIPFVCMTYYNLIYKRGTEKFVQDCAQSGISGVIVPDLPVEESDELANACQKNNVDLILIITPVTGKERIQKVTEKSSGFLYIVSRLGVTGARSNIAENTGQLLKKVNSSIPKAVGFGIYTPKQVKNVVLSGANGVIVGSAFVNIIASNDDIYNRIEKFAAELKNNCYINYSKS
ncbi:tryptophan synthase subunit alpha [Methanohalobium sp.]|uniref:tryptophan synthase subunit alpha n=1 Tax=Methanohalobium sp. TaxID=2837493 RepID=UPI0025E458A9|nr:tryptophan synthase subunit alpha [Methanohalobium sp.]